MGIDYLAIGISIILGLGLIVAFIVLSRIPKDLPPDDSSIELKGTTRTIDLSKDIDVDKVISNMPTDELHDLYRDVPFSDISGKMYVELKKRGHWDKTDMERKEKALNMLKEYSQKNEKDTKNKVD